MIRRFVFGVLTLALIITATIVFSCEGLKNVFHYPTDDERRVSVVEILTTRDDVSEMTSALVAEAKGRLFDFKRTPNSTLVQDITEVDATTLTRSLLGTGNTTMIEFKPELTPADLHDIIFLYRAEEDTGATIIETVDISLWIPMSFVTRLKFPASMEALQAEYARLVRQPDSMDQAMAEIRQMQNIINAHHHPAGVEMIFTGAFADTDWAFSNDELRTLKSFVSIYVIFLDMFENSLVRKRVQTEVDKRNLDWVAKKRLAIQQSWALAYGSVYNKRHGDLVVSRYRANRWKEHWETPAFVLLSITALLCFWQTIAVRIDSLVIDELEVLEVSAVSKNVRSVMAYLYVQHLRYLLWQPNKKSLKPIVVDATRQVAEGIELDEIRAKAEQAWKAIGGHDGHKLNKLFVRATTASKPFLRRQALDQLINEEQVALRNELGIPAFVKRPKVSRDRPENGSDSKEQKEQLEEEVMVLLGSDFNAPKAKVRLKPLKMAELETLMAVLELINSFNSSLAQRLVLRTDLKTLLELDSELVKACRLASQSAIEAILDPPAAEMEMPMPEEAGQVFPRVLAGKKVVILGGHDPYKAQGTLCQAAKELGAKTCTFVITSQHSKVSGVINRSGPDTVFISFTSADHNAMKKLRGRNRDYIPVSVTNALEFKKAICSALSGNGKGD